MASEKANEVDELLAREWAREAWAARDRVVGLADIIADVGAIVTAHVQRAWHLADERGESDWQSTAWASQSCRLWHLMMVAAELARNVRQLQCVQAAREEVSDEWDDLQAEAWAKRTRRAAAQTAERLELGAELGAIPGLRWKAEAITWNKLAWWQVQAVCDAMTVAGGILDIDKLMDVKRVFVVATVTCEWMAEMLSTEPVGKPKMADGRREAITRGWTQTSGTRQAHGWLLFENGTQAHDA